jgi:hypothetical protein
MVWYDRDASWHARPDTRKPKRVHLLGDDERALCSRRIVLITESPIRELFLDEWKCKRCLKIASKKL